MTSPAWWRRGSASSLVTATPFPRCGLSCQVHCLHEPVHCKLNFRPSSTAVAERAASCMLHSCYSQCSVSCSQLACQVCGHALSVQQLHRQTCLADFLTCGVPTGCADRVQVAAGTRRLLPPGLAGLLRAQPRAQPGRPGQGVARGRRAVPHAGPQGAPSGVVSKTCWRPAGGELRTAAHESVSTCRRPAPGMTYMRFSCKCTHRTTARHGLMSHRTCALVYMLQLSHNCDDSRHSSVLDPNRNQCLALGTNRPGQWGGVS